MMHLPILLQVDTTTTGKRDGTVLAGIGFLTSYTAIGEADLKCRRVSVS